MADGQRAAIAAREAHLQSRLLSHRLHRPGAAAGAARPAAGDWPLTVNAVSGYSGGGKGLIAEFEHAPPETTHDAFRVYGLSLAHKHVPEMTKYSGLAHAPMFAPAVGRYAQGMIVEVPLQLWSLPGAPKPATAARGARRLLQGEAVRHRGQREEIARCRKPAPARRLCRDARSRGAERHEPHEALRVRQ